MRHLFTLAIAGAAFFLLLPIIVPTAADPVSKIGDALGERLGEMKKHVDKEAPIIAPSTTPVPDVPAETILGDAAVNSPPSGNDLVKETMTVQEEALQELARLKTLMSGS